MCLRRVGRLRSSLGRSVVAVVVILLLVGEALAHPQPAAAHAELLQADPPPQAVVARAPAKVQLWFTEAVEPRSIEIVVLDSARRRVDAGDGALLSGTKDAISLSLGSEVVNGVYTIQWKVVSAVDGHLTRGIVPFTIGDLDTLAASASVETTAEASSGGIPGVLARWLTILAAVTLTGAFAFVPLMLAPGLKLLEHAPPPALHGQNPTPRGDDQSTPAADIADIRATATRRLLRSMWLAFVLLVLGTVILLVVETDVATSGGLVDALGRPIWSWLTGTRRGALWLVRVVLLLGIGGGLWFLTKQERRAHLSVLARPRIWAALTATGATMLLVQSQGSHMAAMRSQVAVATTIDWLHLVAVALWIGGLIQFGWTFLPALAPLGGPSRTRLLAGLIPRFSRVAGVSVAVILATGIYQTVRLLGGWEALTESVWGRALSLKLLLLLPLLLLGAFNLLIVSPRLGRLAGRLDQGAREAAAHVRTHFRRAVLAEAGLGVLVLTAAAVLISNSPGQAEGFQPTGPFRPFILTTTAEDVSGRLVLAPGRIGLNRFDLTVTTKAGQGVPSGTEVVLRISTLDQDTGVSEARTTPLGGGRYTVTGTYLSTVGLWEVAALVRRPGVDEVRVAFQLALTSTTGQAQVRENRPAAPLERGRELFEANCVQCHGSGARGDGPLAQTLTPRPVDLTVHVPLHGDGEVAKWIANGVPRTAMPAWKGQFTDEEIQAIINYLRQLAEQGHQGR